MGIWWERGTFLHPLPNTEESPVFCETFANTASSPSDHRDGLSSLTKFSSPVTTNDTFPPPPLMRFLTVVLAGCKGGTLLYLISMHTYHSLG